MCPGFRDRRAGTVGQGRLILFFVGESYIVLLIIFFLVIDCKNILTFFKVML